MWVKDLFIFGHKFVVRKVRSNQWQDRLGIFLEHSSQILLNEDADEPLLKQVAIHEIVHAISALFGLEIDEERTDAISMSLRGLIVQSPEVLTWISSLESKELPSRVQLLARGFAVAEGEPHLWINEGVLVDCSTDSVLVDIACGDLDQKAYFLYAILQTGMDLLGRNLDVQYGRTIAESWLSLFRESPQMVEWWQERA